MGRSIWYLLGECQKVGLQRTFSHLIQRCIGILNNLPFDQVFIPDCRPPQPVARYHNGPTTDISGRHIECLTFNPDLTLFSTDGFAR
jgi:hypothetical protein